MNEQNNEKLYIMFVGDMVVVVVVVVFVHDCVYIKYIVNICQYNDHAIIII